MFTVTLLLTSALLGQDITEAHWRIQAAVNANAMYGTKYSQEWITELNGRLDPKIVDRDHEKLQARFAKLTKLWKAKIERAVENGRDQRKKEFVKFSANETTQKYLEDQELKGWMDSPPQSSSKRR